ETMRQEVENTRALLATIVESSGDAIFSSDLDGKILSWNHACELMYGHARQKAVGKHVSFFLPCSEMERIKKILETVRRGGTISPFTANIEGRDGALTHVLVCIAVIRNADGEIVGSSTSLTDITEHKKAEDALRTSEERYRATFEQAAIGIVHAGRNGELLRCNARFAEMLGYLPEEIPGLNIQQITAPEEAPESAEKMRQIWSGELAKMSLEKRYI